jgi:hypothetical protein
MSADSMCIVHRRPNSSVCEPAGALLTQTECGSIGNDSGLRKEKTCRANGHAATNHILDECYFGIKPNGNWSGIAMAVRFGAKRRPGDLPVGVWSQCLPTGYLFDLLTLLSTYRYGPDTEVEHVHAGCATEQEKHIDRIIICS